MQVLDYSSTQASIEASVGGTLTFGQASLTIAPNALASDATGGTQLGTEPAISANLGNTNPTCGTSHKIRAAGYNSLNQAVSTATVTAVVYSCTPESLL